MRVHEGFGYYFFLKCLVPQPRGCPCWVLIAAQEKTQAPRVLPWWGPLLPTSPSTYPWALVLLASRKEAPGGTKMGDAYYLPVESILAKSML